MRVEFIAHGLLLVGAGGLAYWASLPSQGGENQIAIVDLEPETFDSIELKGNGKQSGKQVTLTRQDGASWVIVRETVKPKESKDEQAGHPHDDHGHDQGHDGHDHGSEPSEGSDHPHGEEAAGSDMAQDDAAGAETPATENMAGDASGDAPEPKLKETQFVATDAVGKVYESLSPLRAMRVIGQVDDAGLEAYGLKEDFQDFVVVAKDGTTQFQMRLGRKAYGSSNRFAQLLSDQRVILIDNSSIDMLANAKSRLYERRVVRSELENISSISASRGNQQATFFHLGKPGNRKGWARDAAASQEQKEITTWVDKVGKLRVMEYANVDQQQSISQQEPFFSLSLDLANGEKENLKFYKVDGGVAPSETGSGRQPDYWVHVASTGAYVKVGVNRVASIEGDLDTLLQEGVQEP